LSEELPEINVNEFKKVVESRRSVRIYTEDSIPEDVMRQCLDLALLAPSSFNLQPWEFYWVRSPDKKKKLIEACLSQITARTAAELVVCVARRRTWRKNTKEILEKLEADNTGIPKNHILSYTSVVPFFLYTGFFRYVRISKKYSILC
jgi:nitroreductase